MENYHVFERCDLEDMSETKAFPAHCGAPKNLTIVVDNADQVMCGDQKAESRGVRAVGLSECTMAIAREKVVPAPTNQPEGNPATTEDLGLSHAGLLGHMVDFEKYSYEKQEKREEMINRQAGHVMIAVSFIATAICASIPTLRDDIGLDGKFVYTCFFVILLFLGISFAFASVTMWRKKKDSLPPIREFSDCVSQNYEVYRKIEASVLHYYNDLIPDVEDSLGKWNDTTANFLRWSVLSLWIAMGSVFAMSVAAIFMWWRLAGIVLLVVVFTAIVATVIFYLGAKHERKKAACAEAQTKSAAITDAD